MDWDPQTPVGLDPDMDLAGIVGVGGDEPVEGTDALYGLGQAAGSQTPARLVAHVDVMVGLSPIVSNKDHVPLAFQVEVAGI